MKVVSISISIDLTNTHHVIQSVVSPLVHQVADAFQRSVFCRLHHGCPTITPPNPVHLNLPRRQNLAHSFYVALTRCLQQPMPGFILAFLFRSPPQSTVAAIPVQRNHVLTLPFAVETFPQ